MKKILLIGNGGREHALCEALCRSPQDVEVVNFANAVNPGIKQLASEVIVGNYMDMDEVKRVAQAVQPDFAVIGPDDPIGAGAADALLEIGIKSFAPNKKCAQLESSKSFTRDLCNKYDVPGQPGYVVLSPPDKGDLGGSLAKLKQFYDQYDGQIVVKADGLLGGKGVIVAGDHFETLNEAEDFALKSIEKFGRVVLEEKLIGEEFSLISIVDGETVLDCPAIQDHKRAFVGDTGPNTGGMGCISDENGSLPFLTEQDLADAHEITEQVMKAVEAETGTKFVGVMYGGFMVTAYGIKLIEYNARFGDPEALNILPIMESDFVEVCEAAINQKLSNIDLRFQPVATVVKYLCPEGYPTNSVKNVPIEIKPPQSPLSGGSDSPLDKGGLGDLTNCYFASVGEEDGQYLLKGSRAIGILGTGDNMEAARLDCDAKIANFSGPLFYREDIGTQALMQKRIDHMKQLRGE